MNKQMHAVALVAVGALVLTGCSGDGADDDGKTTLDLLVPTYSDQTKALWEGVIADFEATHDDIDVTLQVESWENINDVIRTKVQSDQAPDVLNIDAFAGYVADDLLYSADEILSDETLADFQDSFVANASMDGKQYGLPFIASARALFYNEELLAEAGVAAPPPTGSERRTAAEPVSALGDGVYGYGLPLGSEEAQAEAGVWFFGAGGGYGDAETLTLNSPENVEAATFFGELAQSGATQPDAGATDRTPLLDVFIQGKIGMIVGLPPTVGQIAEKNPDLQYGMAPIPTKDGEAMTLGVADHLMAFKNDDDKAEAIGTFLDYFYSADVYVPWVDAEGFLPTTKSGAAELGDKEEIAPFLAALPDARFYPSVNESWSSAQGAVQSLIGQVAQGKDPQAVLDEIQAKADA